jgi:hypothetical protein
MNSRLSLHSIFLLSLFQEILFSYFSKFVFQNFHFYIFALHARSLKTLLSTVAEMALRLTAVLPQHTHALRSLACLARNGRAVKSKAMHSQHQQHRHGSASASSSYEESIDILDIDINELLPLDPTSCASLHLILCASLSRFTLVGRIKLHEPASLEPPAAAKMSAWPADQGVRSVICPSIFPSYSVVVSGFICMQIFYLSVFAFILVVSHLFCVVQSKSESGPE